MNIVFMGTPTFALPALEKLHARFDVSAVFSRPDAVSHRGRTMLPSLVKARALELGLPVHTPRTFYAHAQDGIPLLNYDGERVVDAEILAQIDAYKPDVIVAAAYGLLLPQVVLDLPRLGCINIHASLLPRWRGAAPIQRAILAGDNEIGVCIMRMEAGLDTGPFCASATIVGMNKNYQQLINELGELGGDLVCDMLPAIANNSAQWIEQDEKLASYADKIQKGSINLDASLSVQENVNRVRASSHHVRCRANFFCKPAMVLNVRPICTPLEDDAESKNLYFKCADGYIEILELKPDGRREMTGQAFVAGHRNNHK
ncbi:MAG: methionyl-tRNA formyltransferase [Coriobacteriales bacterium]|jgi:methionyl-tRNA formyltransferase|nr:methionyl-tRNA formyltransferase [Coriobacteriales bacterium]